jgi:carboxyl-terminal processing protease
MKTAFKFTLLLFITSFLFQSCEDQDDIATPKDLAIKKFVWKGLNQYYLWQSDVPNLSDTKFTNQTELNTFVSQYSTAESLFNSLRVDKKIDRFSWIVNDYLELEQSLQGTTKNNGVDFGLRYKSNSTTEIFGWVRYIIPNSDAEKKDIKRGNIFYAINGIPLTIKNYQELLALDSYTLNLADFNNGAITPNGKSLTLTKTVLNENPILIRKVIVVGAKKIGYLMYNGFYANYDQDLNNTFRDFITEGVTDLVLDLRYNGGGSVQSATRLASMITGQFTSQVFAKQQWNSKIEAYFENSDSESLKNLFTEAMGAEKINSLKLSNVYVLTSKSTASASELVINGLIPHIKVIQIGDITVGKNVGSITLYDSPTFGKENRNPSHRYAMQPIVLKIVNSLGFGDYQSGLMPNHSLIEDLGNLDVLGNTTEPLLSTAIGKITGTARMIKQNKGINFNYFEDSKSINGFQNQMYLEEVPKGLFRTLE